MRVGFIFIFLFLIVRTHPLAPSLKREGEGCRLHVASLCGAKLVSGFLFLVFGCCVSKD
jgi:hypothetical protein